MSRLLVSGQVDEDITRLIADTERVLTSLFVDEKRGWILCGSDSACCTAWDLVPKSSEGGPVCMRRFDEHMVHAKEPSPTTSYALFYYGDFKKYELQDAVRCVAVVEDLLFTGSTDKRLTPTDPGLG